MDLNIDYYKMDALLSEEHLLVRNTIRAFIKAEVLPGIDSLAQRHEEVPGLMRKLGAIGVLGSFIPQEYGGAGLDHIAYGVIMQELEFGDSAIRSAASVQSSLVMYPIYSFGSEEQRKSIFRL